MDTEQRMAATIVWHSIAQTYPFEWLLAVLSVNTWVKLLVRMQNTEVFGP